MKLHITRANLLRHGACPPGLERFDEVYLGIDNNHQIDLLEIAENNTFETEDVIWALRATVESSKPVSVELAKGCAARVAETARAADVAEAAYAAENGYAARAAKLAADAANHAAYAAYADYAADYDAARAAEIAERKSQREHLIKLLKDEK